MLLLFGIERRSRPDPPPDGLLVADLVAGVVGCLAAVVASPLAGAGRRRCWPLVGAFSAMAGVAVLIALFTVAVHRPAPGARAVAARQPRRVHSSTTSSAPTRTLPYPLTLVLGRHA